MVLVRDLLHEGPLRRGSCLRNAHEYVSNGSATGVKCQLVDLPTTKPLAAGDLVVVKACLHGAGSNIDS